MLLHFIIYLGMLATGIPPLHVFMHEVSKQNSAQAAHNAAQTLHNVQMLEAVKAVRNVEQHQPHNPLLTIILEKLNDIQNGQHSEERNNLALVAPVIEAVPETAPAIQQPINFSYYNGKYRKVPESYRFIWNAPLRTIHDLHYEGVPSLNVCPFRYFDAADVGSKNSMYLAISKVLVSEINRFLPSNYSSATYAVKNLCFGKAFAEMADAFQVDNPDQKNRADEKHAIVTVYNKFYLPCKKKRDA